MYYIGLLSALLLAACAAPAAYTAIKRKRCNLSSLFVWMWWAGEVTGLVYVMYLGVVPLILNYGINLVFVSILLYYNQEEVP